MTQSEEMLQSLVERAERREQLARRRALIYSLAPILLAVALIAFTGWQVAQANLKLASINNQVADLSTTNQQLSQDQAQLKAENANLTASNQDLEGKNKGLTGQIAANQSLLDQQKNDLAKTQQELQVSQTQVSDLQSQASLLNTRLQDASLLAQHQYFGNLLLTAKFLYSQYGLPEIGDLLIGIVDNREIPFNIKGTNPKQGFNSPGFAAYILQERQLAKVNPAEMNTTEQLMRSLPARHGDPRPGDLIFYTSGYAMFYFIDENNQPFVIGMTPLGVQVVDPAFTKVIGTAAIIIPNR